MHRPAHMFGFSADRRPRAGRWSWLCAGLLLALQACSTMAPSPPPSPPTPPPAPEAPLYIEDPWRPGTGQGGDSVLIPPLADRLRALALQEWQLWGAGRWDTRTGVVEQRRDQPRHHEGEPAYTARVLMYWLAVKGHEIPANKLRFTDGSLRAWSAVFISWLMQGAGLPERQFNGDEVHWTYIRYALDNPARSALEPRDAASTPPREGDLICAPRETGDEVPRSFAQWAALQRAARQRLWAFHCDLVVEITAEEAGAIGGNVGESVTWTRTPLDRTGLLLPTAERGWVILLRPKARP